MQAFACFTVKLRWSFFPRTLVGMSQRIFVPLLSITVLTGVIAGSLFLSSSPTSWDDGLRHMTMARVMRSEGIDQTWSRFFSGGYLADHQVDPWFLADVSYIPFTVFSDPIALRLYSIVGIFALLLIVWRLLVPLRLPTAWLCILLVLTLSDHEFITRILLGRPFVWATVFALMALDAILRRKHFVVAAILLLATLFSQLFVFPLFFAGVGVVWLVCDRRFRDARVLGIAMLVGTGLGLALHPQAAEYLRYLAQVFLQIPFASRSLSLGSEMHPSYNVSASVGIFSVCIILFAGGIKEKSLRFSELRLHGTPLLLLLILPLFGAYLFAWMRAIDFLWPLLVLLLAQSLSLSREFSVSLFSVSMRPLLPGIRGGPLVFGCIILAFLAMNLRTGLRLRATDSDRSMAHFAPVSALPAGSRILNPEWFFLPPFIAVNPHVTFATGIDNTFTWKMNPEAYKLLEVYFSMAAQIPQPVVDIRLWMTQLLAIYPSDYLVVSHQWGKHLLPALRETQGLKALTTSGAVIEVFAIDAKKFSQNP